MEKRLLTASEIEWLLDFVKPNRALPVDVVCGGSYQAGLINVTVVNRP